jgi:hypothetical protein
MFFFNELLQKYCDKIRQCPHCHSAFIQFRKNAVYCSREFQSVGYMRRVRGRHEGTFPGQSTDKPPQKKERQNHGQKRRA